MRQETKKEIDLLLRRLSRREGEAARDAGMDESHLDADELSSYAQNALPPAARARYTQHLAECSTCRRLATELSLALGVTTAATPVVAVPASSGLKKFLSSLLSPMVLRYAVPALGVIVVMVVGFVVLRQRNAREAMVAQVDQRTAQLPNAQADSTGTPAFAKGMIDEPKRQQPADVNAKDDTSGPRETAAERPAKSDAPADRADSAAAVAAPAPAPVPTPSDDNAFMPTERKVQSLPVIVPKPVTTLDDDTGKKEAAKREVQPIVKSTEQEVAKEKAQANEAPVADLRPAGRIASDRVQQRGATTAARAGAGEGAATRRRDEESKDEAETRSVAGRKFRKERGIWIDTAYDSPTRTVQMTRGSEQFRALVADEPAIGTIAEQLDGEVIVVWKGRAYRIR